MMENHGESRTGTGHCKWMKPLRSSVGVLSVDLPEAEQVSVSVVALILSLIFEVFGFAVKVCCFGYISIDSVTFNE